MELYLCRLTDEALSRLVYTVGLVRVKQLEQRNKELATQQAAANG